MNAEVDSREPGAHGGKACRACGRVLLRGGVFEAARARALAAVAPPLESESLAQACRSSTGTCIGVAPDQESEISVRA